LKLKSLSIPSALLSFILITPSCVERGSSGDAGGGAGGAAGGTGTGGAGTGGAGTGGDNGAETCRGLDEAACIAESICRPAYGWRPGPGTAYGGAFGDQSYQGCRWGGPTDNETGCNDSLWCGYDPEDGTECWEFSNTCVPLGWVGRSCFEPCPLGAGGVGGVGN
jgi:hypothetical protein